MTITFNPRPKDGQTRRRTWFAWRPVTIDGVTKWLEKVTVIEFYSCGCFAHGKWYRSRFVSALEVDN